MSVFNIETSCKKISGKETCSYCGSISVDEAIRTLRIPGTHFSGSDWKYGWPHKFYIEEPNPNADAIVEVGSQSGGGINENTPGAVFKTTCEHGDCIQHGYWRLPTMGRKEFLHHKLYNNHLLDADEPTFKLFAEMSTIIFGINWSRKDGKTGYASSRGGYQRAGVIGEDGKPIHNDPWNKLKIAPQQ